MAFGQQSGLPASSRQVKDLARLLEQAGYAGFRDARGPLGLTQRQGLGKFTQDEAAELIERLEAEADPSTKPEPSAAPPPTVPDEPEVTTRAPSRAAAKRAREGRQESLVRENPGPPAGRGARAAGVDPDPPGAGDRARPDGSLTTPRLRPVAGRAAKLRRGGSTAPGTGGRAAADGDAGDGTDAGATDRAGRTGRRAARTRPS